MTFLVVNFADSKQKLENDLLRAASVAQKYNCSLVRLDFQQEDGFVSALPLGVNSIKIQRGLTTSAVAAVSYTHLKTVAVFATRAVFPLSVSEIADPCCAVFLGHKSVPDTALCRSHGA